MFITVYKGPQDLSGPSYILLPTPHLSLLHTHTHTLSHTQLTLLASCSASNQPGVLHLRSLHLFFPTYGTDSPHLPDSLFPLSSRVLLKRCTPERSSLTTQNKLICSPISLTLCIFLHSTYHHLTHDILLIYFLIVCFLPRM